MEITFDFGALKKISLPEGWFEVPAETEFAGRVCRIFSSLMQREANFSVILRPTELPKPDAAFFEKTIYSEFHTLDQTELQTLAFILEGMSNIDAFHVESADTGYLNGKRALRVSGTWPELQSRSVAYFIDVDGDASIVQQLFFMSPSQAWSALKSDAEKIFLSAEWS